MPETADIPLHVVASDGVRPQGEGVFLPPSHRLDAFVATAAARGLGASEAVRLALERHFALLDAPLFGLDGEISRRLLQERADAAVPRRQLTPHEAARVRALALPRPVATADTHAGLMASIPDRLLTRFGDRVPARAFRAAHVDEMVKWELAATLGGRTIGEWALRTLADATTVT